MTHLYEIDTEPLQARRDVAAYVVGGIGIAIGIAALVLAVSVRNDVNDAAAKGSSSARDLTTQIDALQKQVAALDSSGDDAASDLSKSVQDNTTSIRDLESRVDALEQAQSSGAAAPPADGGLGTTDE